MHAFGAWLANLAAARGHSGELTRDKIVANINSKEEEEEVKSKDTY